MPSPPAPIPPSPPSRSRRGVASRRLPILLVVLLVVLLPMAPVLVTGVPPLGGTDAHAGSPPGSVPGPGLDDADRLRFEDATARAGIDFVHHDSRPLPGLLPSEQSRFGAGAAAADYDRDGDLDLYLVDGLDRPNRLYRNRGDGTFEDVTQEAGVGDTGFGHMALFLDLDGDGFDDLVVLNDATGSTQSVLDGHLFSQLYRNRGDGTFENVSRGSGFEPVVRILGGATAGDYDHDGDLDLLLTSWFDFELYLYRNDGGFVLTDVTGAAGLRLPETFVPHWTPLFVDVDGDGWQDLFGAVDFQPDWFFRNERDGTFQYVAGMYHVGNDMGVAAGDIDEDGDLDLYTTNITGREPAGAGGNWLYANLLPDGWFRDEAPQYGITDTAWGWGVAFLDADLDGDLDLAAVNGWQQPEWVTPSNLFVNLGGGTFEDRAERCGFAHVGNSRSLLPFDADGDGDLDLVVTDVWGPAFLYVNTSDLAGRGSLRVSLEGTRSNPNGVGARVVVDTGDRVQVREIVAGGSFYAGPPLEAHFGLGRHAVARSVRIVWPSGTSQHLRDVPSGSLRLREPRAGRLGGR